MSYYEKILDDNKLATIEEKDKIRKIIAIIKRMKIVVDEIEEKAWNIYDLFDNTVTKTLGMTSDEIYASLENKIEYKPHTWGAFIYTYDEGLCSNFNSINSNLDVRSTDVEVPMLLYPVFNSEDNYVFQTWTKQLNRNIAGWKNRGASKLQRISLILTKDELNKLVMTEDTVLKLENGNDIVDEIKKKIKVRFLKCH